MKKILSVLLWMSFLTVSAQNSTDVLRYSRSFEGGTARFMAMSGAFGSLGADFSVLSTNPAGIGVYKKSVFVLSPSLYISQSKTDMGDLSVAGRKDNFNMNNYGFVMVQKMNKDKPGWKALQFGLGVNRTNNFNREINVSNHNSSTSLITDYQDQAYGKYPGQLDAFTTDLAWKTYLFQDTTRVNGGVLAYTSALNKGGAYQTENIKEWGSVNEMVMSFGGSYNDKIYIGATIGFPFARFYHQKIHTEIDDADTIVDFYKFSMTEYYETHGNGVNAKFGIIFRPMSFMRFGFSIHTPTWYSMSDYYYNSMIQEYDNGLSDDAKSPDGYMDYKITTPFKMQGSASFIMGRFFIASVEGEYVDYSAGYLKSKSYSFIDENNNVKNKYQPAFNLRAGVELRLRPMAFRIGGAYYGNPYKEAVNSDVRYQASAGFGYRDRNFFLDVAYVYSVDSRDYYMYDPLFIDAAHVESNTQQFIFTTGFKF